MISLKGMTWSHPRGYDPLVACSVMWKERTGTMVSWDKRSLQDFESYPVEELAARYDLIVIDHPHVGQVTEKRCLLPLDGPEHQNEATALAKASVGQSYASYNWHGRQWALPIDAAAQVQAWRPDLIDAPATGWDEVLALAEEGRVLCPLRVPHSLMVFFTLAANLGRPCAAPPGHLVDAETGDRVWRLMRNLADRIDPASFDMDPIAASEEMANARADIACIPLIYGYVSYARNGFRDRRLAFADIPPVGEDGPVGSVLGGTGIAVSARTSHPGEATDFAYWLASADTQSGAYAAAGGQPGHAAAWESAAVNAYVSDSYKNTRATLEGAWVRPRHDGYMEFQRAASEGINAGLRDRVSAERIVGELTLLFRQSLSPRGGRIEKDQTGS